MVHRGRWVVLGAVAVLLLSSCEPVMTADFNEVRSSAAVAALPTSDVLTAAAKNHAQQMCNARKVSALPTRRPPTTRRRPSPCTSSSARLRSTPRSPTGASETSRATDALLDQWRSDPALTGANWTTRAPARSACADGRLYMTEVLRQLPTIPATGLYASPQYGPSTVKSYLGIQYTTAVDYTGTTIPLLLDVYTPPTSAPHPAQL